MHHKSLLINNLQHAFLFNFWRQKANVAQRKLKSHRSDENAPQLFSRWPVQLGQSLM